MSISGSVTELTTGFNPSSTEEPKIGLMFWFKSSQGGSNPSARLRYTFFGETNLGTVTTKSTGDHDEYRVTIESSNG